MITPEPGEPIESVLRRFKKDTLDPLFRHRRAQCFMPRTQERRTKSARARKRMRGYNVVPFIGKGWL